MYFSLQFIQRIYRIGFLLVVMLAITDLLFFFYYPHVALRDVFLATQEQTPLTWISALALFFIALSCFSVYFKTKRKIWYFLSIVFFFFSMDDAIYFHERFSGYVQDSTVFLHFFPSYIWIIIYLPLILFSVGAFFYLLWRGASDSTKKLIITAFLFLAAAIFFDLVDGVIQKNPQLIFCIDPFCDLAVTHALRLTEELLEVFAFGILGYVNIREHCLDFQKEKVD